MVCELYFTVKFSTAPTIILFIKKKHSFSFCVLSPLPSHSHPWRNTTIKTTPLAQEPINVTSVRNLNSHHSFDSLKFGACRRQDPHQDTYIHTYTHTVGNTQASACWVLQNPKSFPPHLITNHWPAIQLSSAGGHRMPCPAQAVQAGYKSMAFPCPVSTHPPNTQTH